jgi:hypothetical protein
MAFGAFIIDLFEVGIEFMIPHTFYEYLKGNGRCCYLKE